MTISQESTFLRLFRERVWHIYNKEAGGRNFFGYGRIYLDASLPACHLYETLGYKTSYHDKWEVENGVILVYEVMEKIRPEDIGQERPKKVLEEQSDSGKTEIFAADVRVRH